MADWWQRIRADIRRQRNLIYYVAAGVVGLFVLGEDQGQARVPVSVAMPPTGGSSRSPHWS